MSRKRLPVGIQATGQLEALPNKRAGVTVPLTSTIKQVLVKLGNQVREGQPLAIGVSPELSQLHGKKLVFVQNGEQSEPTDVEEGETIGDLVEVKKGLFDGDKVVTQRANKFYTQSISGGGSAGADDGHGAEGEANTKGAKGLELPSWLMLVGGSVVVRGAFFGGMAIAGRRKSKLLSVSLTDYSIQHPHNSLVQPSEVFPFRSRPSWMSAQWSIVKGTGRFSSFDVFDDRL